MSLFISANQLKKKYIVHGSFYNLRISSFESLPCRNRLDIRDQSQINYSETPDALFIMMNPGSSAPLEKDFQLPEYQINDVKKTKEIPLKWVLAKPDITQYQVMRVMLAKGWRYTRVINLSDIREPKSKVFYDVLEKLKIKEPLNLHSIFSKHRSVELRKAFEINQIVPVILAWGTDHFLIELASMCFNSCNLHNAKGVACDKNRLLYSHASPTLQEHKVRWLENILKVV